MGREIKNMSASKIKTYQNCPQLFKLRYIEGIDIPETPVPLTRGSAIHEFIEDFHEDLIVKDDGELVFKNIEYPEIPEEDIDHLNQMQKEAIKENVRKQCRNYVEMEKQRWGNLKNKTGSIDEAKKYFEPAHSEVKLYDNEKNYVGIVDRVQRNLDDTYTIYDFKTGSINSGKADYRKQLAMYYHLLNHNDSLDGEIKKWGIISPKTQNIWVEEVKKASITNLHKKAKMIWKAIEEEQFDCPQGFNCMYCRDLHEHKLEQQSPFNSSENPDGGW